MSGVRGRVLLPLRLLRSSAAAHRRGQQTCKACGRPQDEVDFQTSDATWASIVPPRWRQTALCLSCFDRFAAESGVHTVKVFLVNGP